MKYRIEVKILGDGTKRYYPQYATEMNTGWIPMLGKLPLYWKYYHQYSPHMGNNSYVIFFLSEEKALSFIGNMKMHDKNNTVKEIQYIEVK